MQQTMPPGWGSAGQGAGSGPTGGASGGRLTPGARIAGLVICAVLLGVEIAWVVRDINAAGLHDTVWEWLGLASPGTDHPFPATGGLDVVLVAALAGALIAGRRPAATWAFLAAGLVAAIYRLPGLWIFTADWTKGAPLHDRALTTAIAFVVGGAALVLLALFGRQPASGSAQDEPAPPAAAPAIVGGLLLVLVALETAGWQVYSLQKYDDPGYPPHLYKHLLTGETTLSSLLDSPAAYAAWLTVALAVLCGVLAFRRAPAARPPGLVLGLIVLLNGVVDLCSWHHVHLLFKTDHVPDSVVAEQVFAVFHLVAGVLLLVLLAQRGSALPGPARPGWGPQQLPAWQAGGQPGGQAPAWGSSPYQQPPLPPGYQVPHQTRGPGAFGPPPELPPNLPPGTPPPPSAPPSGPSGPSAPPSAPNRDWPSDPR